MKTNKILALFTVAWLTIALSSTTLAAYTENWEITGFHSDITIHKDGEVTVVETFEADFANEAHRGVAREIPYEYYNDLFRYNAQIKFQSATDSEGTSWNNSTYKENGFLVIEMRNQTDTPTNDTMDFVITYKANNVIGFFDTHDEFFWNVNGTDWVVPSGIVSATVHLPKPISEDDLSLKCITGEWGEQNEDCEYKITDSQTINFTTTIPLSAYENLSIVIGMPEGTIPPPSTLDKIYDFLLPNWPIVLPFITFAIMFSLWRKKGRDDQTVRDTIIPHYKPPQGLTPSETGTIIDEKLDPKDITATIIHHAILGSIKINEIEKKKLIGKSIDYELELIKPYETTKEFEKTILEAIFDTNTIGERKLISELKNKFYRHVSKIKKQIMDQLVKEDYFPNKPSTVRAIYSGIGIAVAVIGGNLGAINPLLTAGFVISGMIILGFSYFMPRKTKKGTETYYILKGLYEYIDTAEKDRMKFQEDNNIIFEKLLPYAMSFGLIKKWAKAFDGLIKETPNWYNSSHGLNGPFRMTTFANSLDKIGTRITQNIASRPGGNKGSWSGGSGFSSGGFSGGGFGGGGGHGL